MAQAMVSRRAVLAAAGIGAVAVSLPLGGWRGLFGGSAADPVRDLTLASFTPHLGSTFTIRVKGRTAVPLTLLKAEPSGPHADDAKRLRGDAFSLILGDGQPQQFNAGTHTLVHPEIGALPLFMSPVGAGQNGQRYQIVVDHRASAR